MLEDFREKTDELVPLRGRQRRPVSAERLPAHRLEVERVIDDRPHSGLSLLVSLRPPERGVMEHR